MVAYGDFELLNYEFSILIITLNSQSSILNWNQSQLCLVQFSQQFHALTMQIDVALELLVDAVYLNVIDEGGDFALLQSLVEERERLLEELYVAVSMTC